MKSFYILIILAGISTGIHAQVINVTSATAGGMSTGMANDHLVPVPGGIGIATFDLQTCTLNDFTAGFLGNDYGTICFVHAIERDEFPHPHRVSSYIGSRAFINGDGSPSVEIKWKNTGANYASTDGYLADILTTLNVDVNMEVTGVPLGTPVTVYWRYNIFGGGSTSHEDLKPPFEDPITVQNTMNINGVNQFVNNQFDFITPPGVAGWNEWKNVTGNFRINSGTDFNFSITSLIDLELNEPSKPGGPFGVDQNDGIFRGVITFTVIAFDPVPVETESYNALFSLDIGSDTEISDPLPDGNEYFDPGDMYPNSSVLLPSPTPWLDDLSIFGHDPNPIVIPPFNPAPVGSGLSPADVQGIYFDLDGSDLIQFDLQGALPIPGDPSIAFFNDSCIYEAEYIFMSFDDDTVTFYTYPVSVPVDSHSPVMNIIYSDMGNQDEIQEFDHDPMPVSGIYFQKDIVSEAVLHANLAPDPPAINEQDDDVDALDFIPVYNGTYTPCTQWYFSADAEASYNHPVLFPNFMLDPATIYTTSPAGPVPVIDSTHHDLPSGTDIDAFEFAWVWDNNQNRYGLALLFSVDDDDTLTGLDESGGLDPRMIYYSFMNGSSQEFSAYPNEDDIDALAVWKNSLNGTPTNPNPTWGTKTWNGSVSNDWDNGLNWFPQGTPFDPEDVFIPLTNRKPVIRINGLDCRSVTIDPSADVILEAPNTFTIKGP